MGYTQPYAAYQQTGIKTASKGKLIVMLYEGALKNIHTALDLMDSDSNIPVTSLEKFHSCIVKSQEIITELMVSLNLEQGGDIAKNLMALYRFFNRELMDISVNHNKEKLQTIERLIRELCETWKVIADNTAGGEQRASLNISG